MIKKESITPVGKNHFYLLTAVIIFVLCLDVLMVKLPVYSITNRTSELIIGIYATIIIVSIITQFLYFKISLIESKVNFGFFRLSDKNIKSIAMIIQSLIICMMVIVFIQIKFTESYYTELIKYTIIISSSLSIFFLSLLLIRFLSWYRASNNNGLLLFTISTMAIIANSIIIIIFTHYAFLNVFHVMNPFIPSINNMMFNLSGLKNLYLISSAFEFALIWLTSISILKPYSSNIGTVKFWTLMIIPSIYFISKFQFYHFWLSNLLVDSHILSPVSFLRFSSLFEIITVVMGALFFGIAFWTIARRISDNSLKHFIQISGIGLCLLFLSSQITNLFLLPYPPFGLVSISFASISSFLLFIGLYQAALITSRDSVIRSLIRKSAKDELKFIGSIGTSEINYSISSQIKQVVKRFGDKMLEDNTYEIDDLRNDAKEFVKMAVQTLRDKSMTFKDKNNKGTTHDAQGVSDNA